MTGSEGNSNDVPAPVQPAAASSEVFVAMPFLQQSGEVFVGPGAKKEAELLGLGLTKLSSRRKDDLHLAKRYAMDISIKQIMMRQQKAHQENQQKQSMYAQALSLMARVYIGSISFEVREENIKKAFEAFGPIKTINMSYDNTTGHHKGFAFLEFDVPEAALLAQESMNGHLMGGRNLKVGRPSNMPQAQPIIEMVQQDAKKYYRVYVASVHPDLSETDLKSVFEAFGEVIKCQLARQSATGKGTHRGFGYIEFNNANAMHEAIAGMNMFDLGGQYLRVGKCITPPEALQYLTPTTPVAIPAAAAVAAAAVTARVMAAEATGQTKKASPSSNSRGSSPMMIKNSPHHSPGPEAQAALPWGSSTRAQTVSENAAPLAIAAPPPPPEPVKYHPSELSFDKYGYPVPQQPAAVAPPPPPAVVIPESRPRRLGGFAADVTPPQQAIPPPGAIPAVSTIPPPSMANIPPPALADLPPPPPPAVVVPSIASTSSSAKKKNKKKGGDRSFGDKLDSLLTKQKNWQEEELAKPVTWADNDQFNDKEEEKEDDVALPLAITNNVHSMALALCGDGALVKAVKAKQKEKEAAAADGGKKKKFQYKSSRVYEPKKIQPKLKTAQSLVAAATAGALSDAVLSEVANNEDATLASQEEMRNIRGNDARHLLMAKLARTNRSCILVLKNMVTPADIDEYLEDEIRSECEKYGKPLEVVIANDESAGIVKIFVRFSEPGEVDAAKAGLDNRFFDGRTVKADIYDQALFDHNDLSG